ncbi:MAG: sigma-70 family RNA polymerase sigma factor [Candidatus Acidiferrales bacterium]
MLTAQHVASSSGRLSRSQREEFVVLNLPLVHFIARQIRYRLPPEVLLEDLVNDGVLGLMDAAQKFDPGRNVQMECYARFRIRGAILDSLRRSDWGPRSLRRMGRQLHQAIAKCKARLSRDPSEQEIADELQVGLGRLRQIVRDLHGTTIASIDDQTVACRIQEGAAVLGSTVQREDPFSRTLRTEMKSLLWKAINELPERQREVLRLYNFSGLSMKEVGLALGIGESRVSQLHTAALVQLRSRLTQILRQSAPQPQA